MHYNGSQAPTILNFSLTINLLAMIVLGGWGTFWGPILGTALLTGLPEILRGPLDNWRTMAMGLALALIAVFAPEGLFPMLSRGFKKLFGRKDKAKTS